MYSLLLAFALYWLLSVLNNLIVSMKEESYIIDKSPSVNKWTICCTLPVLVMTNHKRYHFVKINQDKIDSKCFIHIAAARFT